MIYPTQKHTSRVPAPGHFTAFGKMTLSVVNNNFELFLAHPLRTCQYIVVHVLVQARVAPVQGSHVFVAGFPWSLFNFLDSPGRNCSVSNGGCTPGDRCRTLPPLLPSPFIVSPTSNLPHDRLVSKCLVRLVPGFVQLNLVQPQTHTASLVIKCERLPVLVQKLLDQPASIM